MRITSPRNAKPGDFVTGSIAALTRRGLGWGIKTHIAKVDHRYGSSQEMLHVVALCGRRGKLYARVLHDNDADGCRTCMSLSGRSET